jgi:Zn-finger nucleic acid-binding protein
VDLKVSDRQGVEIDYCPACRGVWLDRDELEKIIERTAAALGPRAGFASGDEHYHGTTASPRRRNSSFLGDFFEFD